MDYKELLEVKWPDFLYRAPGTLEFYDVHGAAWHTGENGPDGYKRNGWVKPLNLPSPIEVWEKQDE